MKLSSASQLTYVSGKENLSLKPYQAVAFCVFRGQVDCLKFFIDYHLDLGCVHVVVLNLSDLDLSQRLKESEKVTLYDCESRSNSELENVIETLKKQFAENAWLLVLEEDEIFHYLYKADLNLDRFLIFMNQFEYQGAVSHRVTLAKPENLRLEELETAFKWFDLDLNNLEFKVLDSGLQVIEKNNSLESKICLFKKSLDQKQIYKSDAKKHLVDLNTLVLKLSDNFQIKDDLESRKNIRKCGSFDEIIQLQLSLHFEPNGDYKHYAENFVLDTIKIKNYLDAYIPRLKHKNNNYQKFVVIGLGRTGTTLLVTLLKSYGGIICDAELFNLNRIYDRQSLYVRNNLVLPTFRKYNPLYFLRHICWHNDYEQDVKAVGFKILNPHMNNFPVLNDMLAREKNLKVLFCKRKSSLERMYSETQAMLYGQWNIVSEDQRINSKLTLDINKCEAYFQADEDSNNKIINHLKKNNVDYTEVFYEDLAADNVKEATRVANYLGLGASQNKVTSHLVKQNVKPIQESIENYDELKRHFASSKWSGLFN